MVSRGHPATMTPMPLASALRHPLLAIAEPVAAVLERIGQARTRLTPTKRAGNTGERLAYFHLRRNGYIVVARQWRAPNLNGEVDLIAWHGETLCFIEVKTRSARDRFGAAYTINDDKKKVLRRMASAYIQSLPWHGDQAAQPSIRFDAAFVYLDEKPHRVDLHESLF